LTGAGECARLSFIWLWNDSFSTLNEALLHFHRAMFIVEFEVESAGIADCVSLGVTAPEWSGSRVAILASYQYLFGLLWRLRL